MTQKYNREGKILPEYTTGNYPTASESGAGALITDTSTGKTMKSDGSTWTEFGSSGGSGTPAIEAYDAGTTYSALDLCEYQGNVYRASTTTTGNLPTDTTNWLIGTLSVPTEDLATPVFYNNQLMYMNFFLMTEVGWIPFVEYEDGNLVRSSFNTFKSRVNGNIGNAPETDRTNWTRIGFHAYHSNIEYVVDDMVYWGGVIFKSIGDGNTGNTPTVGGDAYWTDMSIDTNAIHANVSDEISSIADKKSPISADMIIIEDSADSNAKKRVQIGNLPSSTKALSFSCEVAEDGSPAPAVAEKYNPTIQTGINIASIVWQTTSIVQIIADTVTDINDVEEGDWVSIETSVNASNNGVYRVTEVVASEYIEIWNPNRTDDTDDEEGTSSTAVVEHKSKGVMRIRRFADVSSSGGEQRLVFEGQLPADYTDGTAVQVKATLVMPDGGDDSTQVASLSAQMATMNDSVAPAGSFNGLYWSTGSPSLTVDIDSDDTSKNKVYITNSNSTLMTGARKGAKIFIELSRNHTSLTKDIGLVSLEVLYE